MTRTSCSTYIHRINSKYPSRRLHPTRSSSRRKQASENLRITALKATSSPVFQTIYLVRLIHLVTRKTSVTISLIRLQLTVMMIVMKALMVPSLASLVKGCCSHNKLIKHASRFGRILMLHLSRKTV